jgi:hypothetical protein
MSLVVELIGAMKKLPIWVFVWLNFILSPVVMAPFVLIFFDQHPVIICGILSTLLGVGPNLFILNKQRGISKLLSVSHLVWIPFVIYQVLWLTTGRYGGPLTLGDGMLYYYTWITVIVLTISLIFDVIDSFKWFNGDRVVLHAD